LTFNSLAQRRRDPRFKLRRGAARIHVGAQRSGATGLQGDLAEVSASGIAFELSGQDAVFDVGDVLTSVALRVGDCVLLGDILIRNKRELGASTTSFGALLYPDSTRSEDRMMSIISGLAAKQ
jgi:hypothetical protein